jgi:DNA-binding NarL/FixJ family response regulator
VTPTQRHAAIAELDRQGLSSRAIAEELGCTRQTVYYARTKRAAA